MREAMDPWTFVIAAYIVGVGGTAILIAWSLATMARAERRRDETRKR